jgi:hypothetical protein
MTSPAAGIIVETASVRPGTAADATTTAGSRETDAPSDASPEYEAVRAFDTIVGTNEHPTVLGAETVAPCNNGAPRHDVIGIPLSRNVTVPVGADEAPGDEARTDALKANGKPTVGAGPIGTTTVVVLSEATAVGNEADPSLAAKVASPL